MKEYHRKTKKCVLLRLLYYYKFNYLYAYIQYLAINTRNPRKEEKKKGGRE